MAGWGLMMGLGEGLQSVGKMYMDVKKEELLEKAEKRKEERAEQRQIAQEQRAQVRMETTPDPKQTRFIEKDGALWEQSRSSTGNVLEEKLANKQDIDRINLEKRKEEASIQADLAMGDYRAAQMRQTGMETEFLPTKQALEADRIVAQTGSYERANQPKPPKSSTKTLPQERDELIAESPGVVARYAEGEDAPLSKNEFKQVAQDVVEEFRSRGNSQVTAKDLEVAVQAYMKTMGKTKKAGKDGVVTPIRLKR